MSGKAQNLVPNPSFEEYYMCPDNAMTPGGSINFTVEWSNPCSAGNPDYFHTCATTPSLMVPNNGFGIHSPRTGQAYAGFYTYGSNIPDVREYIQVRLKDSLKANYTYCVAFYVSLADDAKYATSKIGANFSTIVPTCSTSNEYLLPIIPQIENTASNPLISDQEWMLISGTFVATGGEQYLTIGNFRTDADCDTVRLPKSGWNASYYYIDDISVIEQTTLSLDADTSICAGASITIGPEPVDGVSYLWQPGTGLSDSTVAQPVASPGSTITYRLTATDTSGRACFVSNTDSLTITVNDCSVPVLSVPTLLHHEDVFIISGVNAPVSLLLYDARGRLVYENPQYINDLQLSPFAEGIYLYNILLPDGTVQRGKVVIISR